jgi:ParB family chromosome partitioning protein
LGRGLDSLIPSAPAPAARGDAPQGDGTPELRADSITPNSRQPRRNFDPVRLEELARSIETQGLIQPVTVTRREDGSYELIAGERRLRAMRDVLKWEKVPVRVMTVDERRKGELALVENLHREDLNPIEEAQAYNDLMNEFGMTHEAIAQRLQRDRSTVTNALRLLKLPEEVRQLIASRELPPSIARALLGLANPLSQIRLARQTVSEGLSARKVEAMVKDAQRDKPARAPEKQRPPHVAHLENRLTEYFGSKVVIDDDNGKGRIVLEYYSVEDAQRLLNRMGVPGE